MDRLERGAEVVPTDFGPAEKMEDFVTFRLAGQLFGVPILQVHDILEIREIAPIPLTPPEVRGSINLRGRIVTVIDMRTRLGLPRRDDESHAMGVTVQLDGELYTLLVDSVGDTIGLSRGTFEDNVQSLDTVWRNYAKGIYRLDDELMIVVDIASTLDIAAKR